MSGRNRRVVVTAVLGATIATLSACGRARPGEPAAPSPRASSYVGTWTGTFVDKTPGLGGAFTITLDPPGDPSVCCGGTWSAAAAADQAFKGLLSSATASLPTFTANSDTQGGFLTLNLDASGRHIAGTYFFAGAPLTSGTLDLAKK